MLIAFFFPLSTDLVAGGDALLALSFEGEAGFAFLDLAGLSPAPLGPAEVARFFGVAFGLGFGFDFDLALPADIWEADLDNVLLAVLANRANAVLMGSRWEEGSNSLLDGVVG